MDDNQKRAANLIGKVVEASPLVQCITNYVSMDIMANTLLAIGASPAMVHSKEEVEDFLKIASALLVNVGTLSPAWVESMQLAASAANELGKPWVLDPVGAGATPFRTQTILALVKLKPTVIRGNASEIMAVAGAAGTTTKGVDSTAESEEALEAGRQLARDVGCVVAITGAVDLVTDGHVVARVKSGIPMLKRITATGCSVTAMVAAYVSCAPKEDAVLATATALAVFGCAAEIAQRSHQDQVKLPAPLGPGTLRVKLLDALHNICCEGQSEECEVGKSITWEGVRPGS